VSADANPQRPVSAHVVVLGSQEDGSGKSTLAMHVVVALLNRGQRVATVDLDGRHTDLTRYIESRRSGAAQQAGELALPTHISITSNKWLLLDRDKQIEFPALADVVAGIGPTHDFIIVDTSATDSDLMRLAHGLADTLITPIDNSSDMFGAVDATTSAAVDGSAYAELVRVARERRKTEAGSIDWVVVCNRLAVPRACSATGAGLNDLAASLGFRCVDGLAERALYRDLFLRGLTALDRLDDATLGARPSLAHVTAQREAMSLITELRLPVEERGRPRAPADTQWLSAPPIVPLGEHDLLET
jgi:chromosome partitioning protein